MKQVEKVAAEDSVSVNQIILSAVAEKTAAIATEHFFAERAGKSDARSFLAVLSKVRERPPVPGDELAEPRTSGRRVKKCRR